MTSMTVSPRLLSIFGKSLYSGDSIEIVSRELIQNSRDACIINKGSIDYTIQSKKENSGDSQVFISVDDKGIGMNLDVLENVFLSLGSTLDNSNGDKVGGFGIAKASIFASDFWSIHTRDNYLDYTMLENGESTRTNYKNRKGSIVECRFNNHYLYSSNLKRIIEYIEFSDIDNCTFSLVVGDDTTLINKQKIGNQLKGKLQKSLLSLGDNTTSINVYMIPPCDNFVDANYNQQIHKGLNIYRLGGLVQFINSSYTDRDTNIIIDVKTSLLPGDKNYPFSMSRESLNSNFDAKIYDFISNQDQNTLTSNSIAKNQDQDDNLFIDPYLYNPEFSKNNLNPGSSNNSGSIKKNRKIKINPNQKKIFKAFSLIMESVNDRESFYTGIKLDDSIVASRMNTNFNIPVYLINPDIFLKITDKDTICLSIWHCIIHEFSHKYQDSHNEKFTSLEGELSREITPNLFKLFNYISRVIFRRLEIEN